MRDSLLIHHDNVVCVDAFEDEIYFDADETDIDSYINEEIIPQISKTPCDVIYIKDNLSVNYMELLGIRVAYHIRLSEELGEKRYLPIMIISEIDGYLLGKLSDEAHILFSKNIFVVKNDKELLLSQKSFKNLTKDEYQKSFLNLIHIDAPSEYESHHDIANEWAIYRWSTALELKSDAITKNYEHIKSSLYFKYLKTLQYTKNDAQPHSINALEGKGNILYLDDEWNKGWGDILQKLFEPTNANFEIWDYNFKDNTKFKMLPDIRQKIEESMPDLVILDLRFTQSDHERKENIDEYTGIKIAKMIKEVNPGIQTIMMSATSQSTIVQKLYAYGVLGYIKKEHPNDVTIDTVESINELLSLSDMAFGKKYLKHIYRLQEEALNLPLLEHESQKALSLEVKSIFEVLNSNMEKKFVYALMSLYTILESINKMFIYEEWLEKNKKIAKWIDTQEPISSDGHTSAKNKISNILHAKVDKPKYKKDLWKMLEIRNDIIHNPTQENFDKVDSRRIQEWFVKLVNVLKEIEKRELL